MMQVNWVSAPARDAILRVGGKIRRDKTQVVFQIPGHETDWVMGEKADYRLRNGILLTIADMSGNRYGLVVHKGEDHLLVMEAHRKWLIKTGQLKDEQAA